MSTYEQFQNAKPNGSAVSDNDPVALIGGVDSGGTRRAVAVNDSGEIIIGGGGGGGGGDASSDNQETEIARLESIISALAVLAGYSDGVETLLGAANTLLTTIAGKEFATQTTLAAILAKLTADPSTQTTSAAILAKLTADPATQTTLAAILSKIIAAPATEAKQDTGNTSLATIAGKDFATQATLAALLAKVIAAPATEAKQDAISTKLDTLHTDNAAATPAGANLIGKVGIDQTTPGTTDSVSIKSQGYGAPVTLTRTADTNAYAAGDVVGAATGSTAALTFTNMGPSGGGEIMITSASLEIDASALISGETSYELKLYSVTPPSALGDNVAWDLPSGDRASYLGKISLGTPVDLGSTLLIETDAINKQITLTGTSLFAYLVTVGGYTPTSARVHAVKLHSVRI